MKITLVMVSSINGKTIHDTDTDIYNWTSSEDSKLFFSLIKNNTLIVMGRKTYEAARDKIVPDKHTLRIVITRNPEKYTHNAVPGQLEFTKETPLDLVKRLDLLGHKDMLLVGGSEINSIFFKESLIDELRLTIEPTLFGTGKNLLGDIPLMARLQLVKIEKLNDRGTLHLTYQVLS